MAYRSSSLKFSDAVSMYGGVVLLGFILLSGTARERYSAAAAGGTMLRQRPCEEVYVVGEGETLHTISDKCGDPFIVERNPHIHDPDDVFPGLVIKITPS